MSELRHLSIIIPSYNARALLRRTLRTLGVAAPEAEIIVVDGASRDGSPEMVRAEFPQVRVYSYANHGFGHAVNRGLEHASGEYLLLLNSDLFVSRAALESMRDRLARDHWLAACAPVLLNEDGTRQHVFGAWYWPNWAPVRRALRVPLLSGACLMTRRDVVREIGGLDENFFLYNEEYDWCARVIRAGYRLEIVPERVVHVGGGSTMRAPELTLEAQRGFLYLAQKHAPDFVLQGLRRAMQLEGFCYSRMDPRPGHRAMWAQLESLTRREAYLESPFELSGRGMSCAQPAWSGVASRTLPRPSRVQQLRADEPRRVEARRREEAWADDAWREDGHDSVEQVVTREVEVAPAPEAQLAADGVIRRIDGARQRLLARRPAKIAGAAG